MSIVIVDSLERLKRSVLFLLDCPVVYFDIEGTGLDPYTDKLLLLSLHGRDKEDWDFTFVYDIVRLGTSILSDLRPVFEHPDILKVAHNAVFDWKHLYHHGDLYISPVYCTMIAEQVLKAGLFLSGFALDKVAERRLGKVLDKTIRESFIGRDTSVPFTDEELLYSASDVIHLEPIYRQQREEIDANNLARVIDVESKLIPITAQLEYNGIHIDAAKLEEAKPVVQKIIDDTSRKLQDEIIRSGAASEITFDRSGYAAVNVGSPKQMLDVLNEMGIDVRSLGKKELSDWDAQWARKNHKSGNSISDDEDDFDVGYAHPVLRQHAIRTAAAKLEGTYILGLLDRINPVTHRIHPGFKQCGAVSTGRMSSVSPNFQNLPNMSKLSALGLQDYNIRSMFIPAPGRDFIICDYSGIELAILAAMCGDKQLTYEIIQGDIHTFVTNSLVGDLVTQALGEPLTGKNAKKGNHKIVRDNFKKVSYGIIYGSTGYNLYRTLYFDLLAVGISITQDMADSWVTRWKHDLFPETGKLLDHNSRLAITRYYTESALGRRRYWEPSIRQDKWRMLAAMREGSNQPIQATCADMLKLSMVMLDQVIDKTRGRIVAPVHDELLSESDHDYTEECMGLVKVNMETAARSLYPDADPRLFAAEPKVSSRYDK